MKANKGEWSEVYVFLKLLCEGKIYAADKDLNRINNIFYSLIKIIRKEGLNTLEYYYDTQIRVIDLNTKHEFIFPISIFKEKSLVLLNEIKIAKGSSFSVPAIESFMNEIKCDKIKSPSRAKRDITIIVKDEINGSEPILGFSIKSQLGNPSTLVNAGQTTNFIYHIKGLSINDMELINSISGSSKIRDRVLQIYNLGGELSYDSMQSESFEVNLSIIDSGLPIIISSYLKHFYSSNNSTIKKITDLVALDNPLAINSQGSFYKKKITHFLRNCALGMTPSTQWDTKGEVNGGFIIVKADGEILCYHIYNKEEFENYLFDNTKFDTASSSRHKFGNLYEVGGNIYLKLNLQVRFIT